MAKAIIMAGGQGERFWPITHARFPKYRIRLNGKDSLLQNTYRRLLKVYRRDSIYVVTTKSHFEFIREELPPLDTRHILIEPCRNNTAPAIFFSCETLRNTFGNEAVVSFFPADHLIQNEMEFKRTMRAVIRLAREQETLVTVGIKPTFPASAYGYIESGEPIPGFPDARRVRRFVEKPNRRKALSYVRRKNFFWNGGIFTWRVGVFAGMMRRFAPKFSENFDLENLSASYEKLPNLSIDYALMEKADRLALYITRMDWCDMGSWDMFANHLPGPANHHFASGPIRTADSSGTTVLNYTQSPIVAFGLKDLIVVQTSVGTLICKKGRSEEAALLFKKFGA